MLVMTTTTKTYISPDGYLKEVSLFTKFGEIELKQIYDLAQAQQWEPESLESRIDRALSMVDANWANPKEQLLLKLAHQGQAHKLDGIEYWTTQIDETRAVGICLNLTTLTLEVMVIDLQWFTPIHREQVRTLSRLCELTNATCFDPESDCQHWLF